MLFRSFNLHHEQYLQIIVNGEIYEVFAQKTKGFNATGRLQLMVDLQAGENEIVLKNPVRTLADSSYTQYSRMAREIKKATKAVSEKTGSVAAIGKGRIKTAWTWGIR